MSIDVSGKSFFLAAATGALIASGVGMYAWKEESRPSVLEVYIFTLASGHSVFVRTPDDMRIVIGGGINAEVVRHISKVLPFYSRKIDVLIANDTLGKNITGLIDILHRYTVGRAYIPGHTSQSVGIASTTDPIFTELLKAAKKSSVPLDRLGNGEVVEGTGDVTFICIFPDSPQYFTYSKASPPEIVFKLRFGITEILLLGTASRKIQKHIASSTIDSVASSRALVTFTSGAAISLSSDLLNVFSPDYFAFSRPTSYSVPRNNKESTPGLDTQLIGERINLRNYSLVKFTSNGKEWIVSYGE
jgi:beta-lactamase superfamily II metal-dependent hydrolase